MLCHIEQKGKGDDTKVPESKSDFSDIILTKEEIEGIHRLQDITEDHKDRIPGFDGLRSARFVTLAHPKSIKSDGYGGYTSDEIYKQAPSKPESGCGPTARTLHVSGSSPSAWVHRLQA